MRRATQHHWLFLDYSAEPDLDTEAVGRFNVRWFIESRPDQEGLWLVCGFPFTFVSEDALDMLRKELALVPAAVEEIRRRAQGGG